MINIDPSSGHVQVHRGNQIHIFSCVLIKYLVSFLIRQLKLSYYVQIILKEAK